MRVELKTGVLEVDRSDKLLELIDFGSRVNKKRGFLFVSKVLGKHLPTKPSLMQKTYRELANLIPKSDVPTLFIGFAETATALGQGVFEEANLRDSLYIHSSRFQTSKEVMLSFIEEHCHAPSHIFYQPIDKNLRELLTKVKRVILIDDEVSTGNTANNLVNELKKALLNVESYYLLTILNWTQKTYSNFNYLCLYQGEFNFYPKDIEFKSTVVSEPLEVKDLDEIIPANFGRYGVQKLEFDFENFINLDELRDRRVLILGTAEFMYPPYLLALFLENSGVDVYFQATTRSPINIDGAISSKVEFKDNYFENIDNFLYNVVDREYDRVFICYESRKLPTNFDLKRKLELYFKEVEEIFF